MPRFTSVRPRIAAAATALALGTLTLTGCALPVFGGNSAGGNASGGTGGSVSSSGGQSKCQIANEAIQRVTDEAGQAVPQLVADGLAGQPLDLLALVDPVVEALDAASASITDPAVREALDAARVEWSGFAEDLGALGAPDLSGLGSGDVSAIGELRAYGEDVSALYTERLPALQQTGTELQAACTAE